MYGSGLSFTVVRGHDYVEGLLDREELVNVQLPMKFDRAKLVAAHEAARDAGASFTDDASLFFAHASDRVRILPGNDRNVKITVPTDIVMAEALYADFIGRGS
jgi:2-C-methyl-D-erythritol 4-phosphate cytidylyltransferase